MGATELTRQCPVCGYRYDSSRDICAVDGSRLTEHRADEIAVLGSYRLTALVGEGGMGAVYRAVHRALGRTVAIKLLRRDLARDPGIVNRFLHEARAANTIRHRNVIEIYDLVQEHDQVYFVMEYLSGADLHDALHRTAPRAPMAPERAVGILVQLAAALDATHAKAIVHRDLKPENVFLTVRGGVRDFVKLLDYGIAKLHRPDGRQTMQGAVIGTPEYMSPEQAHGLDVDARSDVYALACIAYEMLTLHQVFGGGPRPLVLLRQARMTPPPLRSYAPQVPPALDAAVRRALAKAPEDRPPSAGAFAEDLLRALGRRALPAGAAVCRTKNRPATGRAPAGLVWRGPKRPAWRQVAVVTAAATLIGSAGMASWVPRSTRRVAEAAASVSAAPRTVTVSIDSVPAGAEILDGRGVSIGHTPCRVVLPSGTERRLELRRPGYRPSSQRLRGDMDTTIAVHLEPEKPRAPRRGRVVPRSDVEPPLASRSPAATMNPLPR